MVAQRVGSPERLSLLHALTEADGRATGPTAWGSWKAQLVDLLAARVVQLLDGGEATEVIGAVFPSDAQRARMRMRIVEVFGSADRLTVICPDRRGVFSRVAGALSLHDLDVVEANVHSERGMALEEIRVSAGGSGLIAWDRVADDVRNALEGRLALEARLAERHRGRRRLHTPGASQLTPSVTFDNDDVSGATVVEATGPDELGLLYRLTRALADMDLDVSSAKIHTLGGDAIDTFYVTGPGGDPVTDPEHQAEVERALLHVLDPSR
jgi:[protein-PII] uridylyltransferase